MTHLDAEECWTQICNALREVPGLPGPSGEAPTDKFITQFMTGRMRREYVLLYVFAVDCFQLYALSLSGTSVTKLSMKHLQLLPRAF